MKTLDETIIKLLLTKIENLNSVNAEEVVKIMLEIKQDGEKI